MTAAATPWIVVPAKPLAEGKARLGLPPASRGAVNRAFLGHVVAVAAAVASPDRTVVVSRDEAALALARRAGARGCREGPGGDVNDALALGAGFARARGAAAVLSVFADLPWLGEDDLRAMVERFDGDNLVIAPDEAGNGSNALLMAPGLIPYRHGRDSFWHHLAAARAVGARFDVVRRDGLMRDVDLPAQWAAWRATLAVGRDGG